MDNRNNSGDYNSGYRNSGNYNSGYRNSGDCNSGDCNSGNCNSGYRNSGNRNSGDCNSGIYNSGIYNSGNYNSGNYNSGFFNTDEPNVRLFNKETTFKRSDIQLPYIDLLLTEWIPEDEMTDAQKADDPQFSIKGGTLITRTYHEAWAIAWSKASDELKQQFLDLPNFDAEIFKEITGIDVKKESATCEGKIVEIDGKKYRLSAV